MVKSKKVNRNTLIITSIVALIIGVVGGMMIAGQQSFGDMTGPGQALVFIEGDDNICINDLAVEQYNEFSTLFPIIDCDDFNPLLSGDFKACICKTFR